MSRVCLYTVTYFIVYKYVGIVIYISAWGFCVARFDKLGNAKASKRGTSNRYRFHVLFIYMRIRLNESSDSGICGLNTKSYMLKCYHGYAQIIKFVFWYL